MGLPGRTTTPSMQYCSGLGGIAFPASTCPFDSQYKSVLDRDCIPEIQRGSPGLNYISQHGLQLPAHLISGGQTPPTDSQYKPVLGKDCSWGTIRFSLSKLHLPACTAAPGHLTSGLKTGLFPV